MNRILLALAISDVLVLTAAASVGLMVEGESLFRVHFALALFGALLTMAIHVVVFTYFSGTGRMIAQAVTIGGLDRSPLERLRSLKARVSRVVGLAALSVVIVVSLGALIESANSWHWWHLAAAGVCIATNGWAFRVEYDCVVRNARLMDSVFAAYDERRAAVAAAATLERRR